MKNFREVICVTISEKGATIRPENYTKAGMEVITNFSTELNEEGRAVMSDSKLFEEVLDNWRQSKFECTSVETTKDTMEEIAFGCLLENIPTNNFNAETSNILVVGPYYKDYIMQLLEQHTF